MLDWQSFDIDGFSFVGDEDEVFSDEYEDYLDDGAEIDEDENVFTEEDKETIRDAFMLFDADGNGTICINELEQLLAALGQSPTEAQVNGIEDCYFL